MDPSARPSCGGMPPPSGKASDDDNRRVCSLGRRSPPGCCPTNKVNASPKSRRASKHKRAPLSIQYFDSMVDMEGGPTNLEQWVWSKTILPCCWSHCDGTKNKKRSFALWSKLEGSTDRRDNRMYPIKARDKYRILRPTQYLSSSSIFATEKKQGLLIFNDDDHLPYS